MTKKGTFMRVNEFFVVCQFAIITIKLISLVNRNPYYFEISLKENTTISYDRMCNVCNVCNRKFGLLFKN